ncbi:hypothetical protein JCM10213_006895 [Rhodosporidiobolus nylandii]
MPPTGGLEVDTATRFMASHLYRTLLRKQWVHEGGDDAVAVRLAKRSYIIHPVSEGTRMFEQSLHSLNADCAVTVSSDVVKVVAASLAPDADVLSVTEDTNIQIVENMAGLAHARAAQHACFIRSEKRLVVWADRVDELEETVQEFESKLIDFVFARTLRPGFHARSTTFSTMSSSPSTPKLPQSPSFASLVHLSKDTTDEKEAAKELGNIEAGTQAESAPRRLPLMHAIYTGLATALNFVLIALLPRSLLHDCFLDGQWLRLAICCAIPFLYPIYMFFCSTVVGVIAQLLLPIGQMGRNHVYYSALPPPRTLSGPLPHISILMPVYKESLEEVLAPTIESVSAAIRTYELQGGTASIIVCEDGMQLVDEAEQEKRKDYYDRVGVAWVARPKDGRAGRFKKSSNLNVTHALSLHIEEIMDTRRPTAPLDLASWSQLDEDALYDWALQEALAEKEGAIQVHGDIRHGSIVLLIDSDTRVPRDCFLDAACEMEQEPTLGILQHKSGSFLAGAGYFENYIAYFTETVNFSISWTVASGGAAPFMGHNAYLRWSAMQHQALANPDHKIWSEEHVSEDFVMSLNLMRAGYIGRWATYANGEYKEGVSLSCDDELNRWQKYAFGCSEMIFQPFRRMWTRGPLSSLITSFLFKTPTPLPTKVATMSYGESALTLLCPPSHVFSYWAIACAPPLSLAFWWIGGQYTWQMNSAYQSSFHVFVAVLVLYSCGGTISIVVSRYRSQEATIWRAVKEAALSILPSFLFFSGLSFHVMTALLAHFTGYNMQWAATKKDLETPTIQEELPVVFKRHWLTFLLGIMTVAGVIICTTSIVPLAYRIEGTTVILPVLWLAVGHIIYPLALNPSIMLFRF